MKTILYVHDQQDNPNSVVNFLELAGYNVELVQSGEQCMQRLAKGLPSMVLMDVLIEGKNGFEITRAIRKQFISEQLPVVLCSSIYRSRIYREEAMQSGAQLYVLKPLKLDELAQMIHELLDVNACLLSTHQASAEVNEVHRPSDPTVMRQS